MHIDNYPSHKEIHYDELNDVEALMMHFSVYDDKEFVYKRFMYELDEEKKILYIPSGIPDGTIVSYLAGFEIDSRECGASPWRHFSREYPIPSTFSLKDDLQRISSEFLVGCDSQSNTKLFSKKVLVLPTGTGKTVICGLAAMKMKKKTLIICPNDNIRGEWVKTFTNIFKLPNSALCVFTSDETQDLIDTPREAEIFLTLHQSSQSIVKRYGSDAWNQICTTQGIGLKIVDEVHLFPMSTMTLDYFTNVETSFYVTATFERTNKQEKKLFHMAFKDSVIFDLKSKSHSDLDNRVLHTKYYHVLYDSKCSDFIVRTYLIKKTGFNVHNFATYALFKDPKYTMAKVLLKLVREHHNKGKMLILSPTKEAVHAIKEMIEMAFDHTIPVGMIVSGIKTKQSEMMKDIIVSTSKSCGTGVDIPGLAVLINTESYGNEIYTTQLQGRLRPRGGDKLTWMFDLVDISVKPSSILGDRRMNDLRKLCKSVDVLDMTKLEL